MKVSGETPVVRRLSPPIPMRALGIFAGEISREAAELHGLEEGKGIVVTGMLGSHLKSPAAKAGVKIGDIICEINGLPVTSPGAMKRYLSSYTIDVPIGILLRHKDIWRFLTVRLNRTTFTRRRSFSGLCDPGLQSRRL